MNVAIIPYDEAVFNEVRRWYAIRVTPDKGPGKPPPMGFAAAYFEGGSRPVLLVTVCAYPSELTLALEFAATNPELPDAAYARRLVHSASVQLLEAACVVGTALGVPTSLYLTLPSLERLAERVGFKKHPSGPWYRYPGVAIRAPEAKERKEKVMQPDPVKAGAQRRSSRRAKT